MGKFDPSSGNTDRPTFASTQRGMYTAGYLDGSGSSHEGMGNQISSTLPSMSTSSSPATEREVMSFLHGLPFNTKFMPVAFSRQSEVERAVTSALGVSQDDPSSLSLNGRTLPASSHEDIKRVRNNLSESSNRARERVKTLEEVVSRFDMCFPRIAARKRSLVAMPFSDRSTASLLSDRAVFGGNMAKLRTENHVMASNVDIDPQKLEERNLRTKGAVPKRVWTSMVDVRMDVQANDVTKPPGALDKDKETFRFSDSGAVLSEEKHQTLTIHLDGWEKPKMRKKRSGIKPKASMGMVLPKHVDGDQDSKWTLQQRLLMEVRPELSNAHGFRSSPAIGATGGRKVDTTSQKEGLGFHSSSARTDQDNGFLPTEEETPLLILKRKGSNLKSVNSKAGRPPTKKMSDRKAYRRPKFAGNGGSTNYNGEPDDDHEELVAAAKAAMDPSHACSSSFWKEMELLFGSVSDEAAAFLKQQISAFNKSASGMNVNSGQNLKDDFESSLMKPTLNALGQDDSGAVLNRLGSIECERDEKLTSETKPDKYLSGPLLLEIADDNVISLFQRLVAALILKEETEGFCSEDEDLNLNIYGTNSELDEEKCNNLSRTESDNFQTVAQATSNDYRTRATQRSLDQMETGDLGDVDFLADTTTGIVSNFQNTLSGLQPDQAVMPGKAHSERQYEEMKLDERLQLELRSIDIFPGSGPDLALQEHDEINAEIRTLQLKQQNLAKKKQEFLLKLESSVSKERESREREIEREALDKLVCMTYDKYMACSGPNASSQRGSNRKMAKRAALSYLKRTLERCRDYEDTGKSCFNKPVFKDLFHSVTTCPSDTETVQTMTGGKPASPDDDTHSLSSEVKVSDSVGLHQTPPATSCLRLNTNTHENNPSDVSGSGNHLAKPTACNEETLMSRAKKRELLLDEHVGGTGGSSLRAPSVVGNARVSSTKGKRSEKEEGKGQNQDLPSGNGTDKFGLPALGNVKDKRKSEVKPKQKTTHLSASANDLLDKSSEPSKAELSPLLGSCEVASDSNIKKK